MNLVDVYQLWPTWSDMLDENVPRVNITYEVFMIGYSFVFVPEL